ncbi:MAG: alanine racemase [Firmicutes bacterium]|nr:alanine racemase [Bacillota bacterium]
MDYKRTAAFISKEAIKQNIINIRKITDPTAKIMAVIKADGYGHTDTYMADVLFENGADCAGVAVPEEGIKLRNHGLTVPILILGNTLPCYFEDVVKYDLTQAVCSYEHAKLLSEEGKKRGKTALIHIKLDTGMHRIGFLPTEESADEIKKISQLENIKITGMFTHFAAADSFDKSYTKLQQENYMKMVRLLAERGVDVGVKHWANSAAIMDLPGEHMDMVRAGIILYGFYPSDEVKKERLPLEPVLTWKTRISFIKELDANQAISYGCTYKTDKKSKIATIPVGYADGYSRLLSNKGRVIINGEYANIVGRVCMDQFMVDVTHIPDAKEGDEVILIGKQGDKEVSADEIANIMGTINYEVTCLINTRVPRILV